jgi:hypothetical protein
MVERYSGIQHRQQKGDSSETIIQATAEGVCTAGDDSKLFHE